MCPIGRIFGQGRQIENLLRKAEEAFGAREWDKCAQFAKDLQGKINPENPGKFANELLRAYYLEAASYQKKGVFDKALDIIADALNQSEGLGDIAKILSEIASESKHPRITEILERASEKLPDNNLISLALCDKYVEAKKFDDETFPLFKKMHQRIPDNKIVVVGLAMCYFNQQKFDRSTLAVYRRAFHEFSTSQDLLFALAKTYATQIPPVNEALPVIERALKFYPDDKSFQDAKIAILANLPSLSPEQVKLLLAHFKKTKDVDIAQKLVLHLLAAHADDEDACRIYEAVWKEHPKRTTLLSILAERYRMTGRRDPAALEVFQAFFDEMPRERENTIYLARRYAEKGDRSDEATLVYQQSLRDGVSTDLDNVVLALAHAYLDAGRADEESARIYRMAHNAEPDNYAVLTALKEVALAGGRMDGARANPLIDYIRHPETSDNDRKTLASKLGAILAGENRTDKDACSIYRINVDNKSASDIEEKLLVDSLINQKETKIGDIPLLERVYMRGESDSLATVLAHLYQQTGELSEKRLPVIFKALNVNPGDKKLGGWALPYLLNKHGQNDKYFKLIADLIAKGHLAQANGIGSGVLALSVTRIARDMIREGKFKQAVEVLSEAFKFDRTPIIQYLLGVSYQGSGDFRTGLGIFRDLHKSDKANPAYSYRIAVLNMMSGDIEAAQRELSTLAKRYPDHPLVLLRTGLLYESEGKTSEALDEYARVKSSDKHISAFAEYRMGIICLARGDIQKGAKFLDRASGGGIHPDSLETARHLAQVAMTDNDIASGLIESAESRLIKLSEHHVPPWPQAVNERLFRLGLIHLENARETEARRVLEAAENTGIRDARVSAILAVLDLISARPKAAIEHLERVLSLKDKVGSEFAHRIWAVISMKLGRHEDAREAGDWLMAHNVGNAARLRALAYWRNPVEVDWPPALSDYSYEDLEDKFGFPVGLIGRIAYKRADYEGGAKYLEKYYKDEKKPERVEAEFLLGLMYIKQKKPNLGLHYWSRILKEGYKELNGKQRIEGLLLLGFHFLEHGEPDKSREAFKLAGDAGADMKEIDKAVSLSHLQSGYLAAKSDNMLGAIREWEKILESDTDNWQAIQNLGLAHFWMGEDQKSLEYFNKLFVICNDNADRISEDDFTFVFEETRKMINQLVSLQQTEPGRAEVKREMLLDEIQAANRHYWTLGVKKGITSEEAQANYFRLLKIYNPEKYPRDFMVLEKAYEFFNKPGLLKKNEQKVFNAFHFKLLGLEQAGGMSEIPLSPSVIDFIRNELDPKNQIDFKKLMDDSMHRKEKLPSLNTSPDFSVPDYLSSW